MLRTPIFWALVLPIAFDPEASSAADGARYDEGHRRPRCPAIGPSSRGVEVVGPPMLRSVRLVASAERRVARTFAYRWSAIRQIGLDETSVSAHHRGMSLRLCASCSRHVRDALCPFCGATESAAIPAPHSRATRAAMVFGAATMVTTAIACGGTTVTGDAGSDAATTPTGTATGTGTGTTPIVPPYGAPPPPRDAEADSPIAPAYGGPPPDAGAVPPYGAPPPDGGR